jgi:hypothetical protein
MFRTIRIVVVDADGKQESALIRAARDSDDKLTPAKLQQKQQYYKGLTPEQIDRHEGQFGEIAINETRQIWLLAAPTTSGQHDEAMREILSEGADGFIFVVNCIRPETFPEMKKLIQKFRQYVTIPCLVAASGMDASGLASAILRDALNLPDDIDLMPCNIIDTGSAVALVQVMYQKVEADTQP